jgi:hypothetical protein
MLTHQLTLALHHTSAVLKHEGLVHRPLKVLKVPCLQSIGYPVIQAIQEAFLLLLISVDLVRACRDSLVNFVKESFTNMDPYIRS